MIVYGHRGAKGEAPENTLAGFTHAYRHGVRHFELDLVLSKDGKPVIVHDLTVDRTTGQEGSVSSFTAEELAGMDARRSGTPWPRTVGIPSLETLLNEYPDFEHLQLEVKKDSRQRLNILCNRLIEVIQRRDLYNRVAITSSDHWFLQQARRRDTKVRIGLVTDRKFPKPVNAAARLHCDFLCIGWRMCTEAIVNDAHRRGMHVSTWTVNRIHDMLQLEAKGVDSIITDYPTSTRMYFDNRSKAALHLPAGQNRADSTQSENPVQTV
ncbi:glycerophosphodiester phosphodiesterase [Marinobacter panjinensis]|uniref:Glycerophosphodiester phosphodiesterase n=1 Tax=Marinobacter panjinensis TaxID=2576384 RepID=A0A4U6R226_9GAMM|nr:glycerophosphodiester phosphodiesterase [Marinobacter panjinensis]MCR8913863.1 glycerophosphodiester phosphodiesterase [Marinobacter panjinensis]TKV67499.1 glycerophosphodiester phosphodiesterase [Marinobacter panjinensis]